MNKHSKLNTQIQKLVIVLALINLFSLGLHAQGFETITALTPAAAVKNTGEKPQSKVWNHGGKWWSVFPDSTGTYIWRLDGTTWAHALRISTNKTVKADCKVADNVTHIFLWKKEDSPSQLVSVEFVPASGNYKLWSGRTATVSITLDIGVETGTIDIDGTGRMWLASDGINEVNVRWSDPPYSTWSAPVTIAANITDDDICDVIALPVQHQVGVIWSNQNTRRFGFKTHTDGTDPTVWSSDEVPASQSALNIRQGMSDDHVNLAVTADGTIYAAVKTGYDTPGYPMVALLKRQPTGGWDDLYEVSPTGTRPIAIINETIGKIKVIYTAHEDGGDILYRESLLSSISFGPAIPLITGLYNNPTSSKDNYNKDIVILASNSSQTQIVGVLASDIAPVISPETPILLSPANMAAGVAVDVMLHWQASANATSYHVQVSTTPDFSGLVTDQDKINSTTMQVANLEVSTLYYWRVRAMNSVGSSNWSAVWSFTTVSQPPTTPVLLSPLNLSAHINTTTIFYWSASARADSYTIQIAEVADFSTMFQNRSVTTPSFSVNSLSEGTKYYWRVLATNALGNSLWSEVWEFTTISRDLVGYWKMDEGSGTTLMDASGYENHAVTRGSPLWVAGVSNLAIRLNGTTQYAQVNDSPSLDISNAITLAAWIRPEKRTSQYIFMKGQTVDGYQLSLLSSGKISFNINHTTSSTYKLNSRALYPTDGITWMHVAATFDGSTARLYINGVLDKSITFSYPALIKTNNDLLTLGAKNDGKSGLSGALDEVQVYNYALTGASISELVHQTSIARSVTGRIDNFYDHPESVLPDSAIAAYPNPAHDYITLTFPGTPHEDIFIALADMQGKVYFTAIIAAESNHLEINLTSLNLNAGWYLIRLRSAAYVKTFKFIKR